MSSSFPPAGWLTGKEIERAIALEKALTLAAPQMLNALDLFVHAVESGCVEEDIFEAYKVALEAVVAARNV